MKRRDTFIFVAKPGAGDKAKDYLADWLRSLDGHPGYLGGVVLQSAQIKTFEDIQCLDHRWTLAPKTGLVHRISAIRR